jgi:hypothetical protein
MKIWGCLVWFDEEPRWLAASVASFAKLCDHVIAVDGAYFSYPEGRAASGGEQAESIVAAARTAGIGCTIHVPQSVWMGNETEKRSCYARIANALGTPYEDWMLVLDADEEISWVSPLARTDLETTELDAAELGMWTTDEMRSWYGPTRRLYRLLPGLEYGPTHFSLRGQGKTGDTVWLYGLGEKYGEPLGDALNMVTQIRVEHKHHLRSETRQEKADVVGKLRSVFEPWPEPVEV